MVGPAANIDVGAGRVPPGPAGRTESTSESMRMCGCGLFLGLSSGPQAKEGDATSYPAPEPRPTETVEFMLSLGFSPRTRNGFGEQPLHTAAFNGKVETVRLLLDAGADVDAHDDRFDSTPLASATVGSGAQEGTPGGWFETVKLLIGSGASREGVWNLREAAERGGHRPLAPLRDYPQRTDRTTAQRPE